MQHLDMQAGGLLWQGGTFNNNVLTMAAGLIGARDIYAPAACTALGDLLREQFNELGRSMAAGFQATGVGGVLTVHWQRERITEPSTVEPAGAPKRRLFHLEMLDQGFYIAQRGMICLSLPVQAPTSTACCAPCASI